MQRRAHRVLCCSCADEAHAGGEDGPGGGGAGPRGGQHHGGGREHSHRQPL